MCADKCWFSNKYLGAALNLPECQTCPCMIEQPSSYYTQDFLVYICYSVWTASAASSASENTTTELTLRWSRGITWQHSKKMCTSIAILIASHNKTSKLKFPFQTGSYTQSPIIVTPCEFSKTSLHSLLGHSQNWTRWTGGPSWLVDSLTTIISLFQLR